MKQHRALLGNLVLLAALCLGLLFATWRPLLAPWVNDEPRLIANALDANAARQLARQGLVGNFTVHYGPLPTWIYQGLLAVTHDISSLLVLHAVLFYGATVGAMWCVGRAAGLPRAFVGVVGVSPVVCYYSRALWDNSMLVPLSLAILAAYAGWLASPTRWRALGLTLLCGGGGEHPLYRAAAGGSCRGSRDPAAAGDCPSTSAGHRRRRADSAGRVQQLSALAVACADRRPPAWGRRRNAACQIIAAAGDDACLDRGRLRLHGRNTTAGQREPSAAY